GILALARGGYPVKSWFGVGLSVLGIVLAVVTYVAIYNAVDDASDEVTVQAPGTSSSSEGPAQAGGDFGLAPGTAVTVSNADRDMNVVGNSVSEVQPGEFDSASGPGMHYIVANVSYECVRGACGYNSYDWTAKQEDGTQSDWAILASLDNSLDSGELAAGNRVRGDVAFEVPVDSSGTIVLSETLGGEVASWRY
nr:DUF4352 domain-containing protein [Micromonospora sp. DSM 115978]